MRNIWAGVAWSAVLGASAVSAAADEIRVATFDSTRNGVIDHANGSIDFNFLSTSSIATYTNLRAALLDQANFGPDGIVPHFVTFEPQISELTDAAVADTDVLIIPFVGAFGLSPSEEAALAAFVTRGGGAILWGPTAGVETQNLFGATIGAYSSTVNATFADTVPATSGPFGSIANGTTTLVGFHSNFADVGAAGTGYMTTTDATIAARFTLGAGCVYVIVDEAQFSQRTVLGITIGRQTATTRRLFQNAFADVIPDPPVEPEPEPVVSFLLPTSVVIGLGDGASDKARARGAFDNGGTALAAGDEVTLRIGPDFERTFTLEQRGRSLVAPRSAGLKFALKGGKVGSSRGTFSLRGKRLDLGSATPDAPLAIELARDGSPPARCVVGLNGGRFRFGRVAGSLAEPGLRAQTVVATLGAENADSLRLVCGFLPAAPAPAELGDVRIAFGPTFTHDLAGSEFTGIGGVFRYSGPLAAGGTLSVVIDFPRETLHVTAVGAELGEIGDQPVDIVFGSGGVEPLRSNTIQLGTKRARRIY